MTSLLRRNLRAVLEGGILSEICEVLKIDFLSSYFKFSGFGLGKLCLTFLSSVSYLWEVWFLKICALMRSRKISVGFSLLHESLFLLF